MSKEWGQKGGEGERERGKERGGEGHNKSLTIENISTVWNNPF